MPHATSRSRMGTSSVSMPGGDAPGLSGAQDAARQGHGPLHGQRRSAIIPRRAVLQRTAVLMGSVALAGLSARTARAGHVVEVLVEPGPCVAHGKPCRQTGDAAAELKVEVSDPRFYAYVGTQFRLDLLFDGATQAGGPAWLPARQALIFSDAARNLLYRWTDAGGAQVFRSPAHRASGNAVDADGRLVTAERGRRAISRTDAQGQVQLLAERLEGRRFNAPRGIAIHPDGSIWFSDPPDAVASEPGRMPAPSEMVGSYVYRLDPKTGTVGIATFETFRPAGLAFSPDGRSLYVVENSSVEFPRNGQRQLLLFDVAGTRLKNRRVLAEIRPGAPEAVVVRPNGIIFCSSGSGLIALLPDGSELGRLTLGRPVTGGIFADERALFFTTASRLYRLKLG